MTKIYCINCNKFKKFKNPKIYSFDRILVLPIICGKCSSNDEKMFKEEESTENLFV